MKRIAVLVLGLLMSVGAHAIELNVEAVGTERQRDQYFSYNFGRIFEGQSSYAHFTLTAHKDAPAEIEGIRMRGGRGAFDVYTNCPRVLPPGNRCNIRVRFWPPFTGYYSGEMALYMKSHDIYVRLYGESMRRF